MHTTAAILLLVLGVTAPAEATSHALLRLDTSLTTRTATVGDPVYLRTATPIVLGGLTFPEGSPVRGVVSRARRPGRVRGRGQIAIGIVAIARPDGTMMDVKGESPILEALGPPPGVPPSPVRSIAAGMTAGYTVAAISSRWSHSEDTVAGSGVVAGVAVGVLVGVLQRGSELVLPAGSTIDVLFDERAVTVSAGTRR